MKRKVYQTESETIYRVEHPFCIEAYFMYDDPGSYPAGFVPSKWVDDVEEMQDEKSAVSIAEAWNAKVEKVRITHNCYDADGTDWDTEYKSQGIVADFDTPEHPFKTAEQLNEEQKEEMLESDREYRKRVIDRFEQELAESEDQQISQSEEKIKYIHASVDKDYENGKITKNERNCLLRNMGKISEAMDHTDQDQYDKAKTAVLEQAGLSNAGSITETQQMDLQIDAPSLDGPVFM